MSGIFSIIAPNVMHEIKGCCLYEDSFWLVLCSQKLSIALVLTGHRVPLSCQLMALLTASAGSSADCITWLISWLRSTTLLADMTPGIALTVLTTHHCKPLYPPPPQLHPNSTTTPPHYVSMSVVIDAYSALYSLWWDLLCCSPCL